MTILDFENAQTAKNRVVLLNKIWCSEHGETFQQIWKKSDSVARAKMLRATDASKAIEADFTCMKTYLS